MLLLVVARRKDGRFSARFHKQGCYNDEQRAARAHNLANLKYWGMSPKTELNFNMEII
ncbi:hypothetical protein ACP4OV_006669 [Aristida adscensionis]